MPEVHCGWARMFVPTLWCQLNRQLPFKGEWIEEFIDLDVTNVSRQYIRRMSTAIEMSRYAGDRTMTSKFHEIDDAFDDLIMSTTNADKKQVLREGREAARRRRRGRSFEPKGRSCA